LHYKDGSLISQLDTISLLPQNTFFHLTYDGKHLSVKVDSVNNFINKLVNNTKKMKISFANERYSSSIT